MHPSLFLPFHVSSFSSSPKSTLIRSFLLLTLILLYRRLIFSLDRVVEKYFYFNIPSWNIFILMFNLDRLHYENLNQEQVKMGKIPGLETLKYKSSVPISFVPWSNQYIHTGHVVIWQINISSIYSSLKNEDEDKLLIRQERERIAENRCIYQRRDYTSSKKKWSFYWDIEEIVRYSRLYRLINYKVWLLRFKIN